MTEDYIDDLGQLSVNNNASAPNKAIFKVGAYRWLNKDESECLLCPPLPNGRLKVIKTLKYSVTGLVNHLSFHPEQQEKYKALLAVPEEPLEAYFTPIGNV